MPNPSELERQSESKPAVPVVRSGAKTSEFWAVLVCNAVTMAAVAGLIPAAAEFKVIIGNDDVDGIKTFSVGDKSFAHGGLFG